MKNDWTARLGPAVEQLDADQRDRFEAEAAAITDRYGYEDPRGDLADERDAALSALVQYLLGDTTPAQAGAERLRTQVAARHALVQAQVVSRLAVLDGMTESEAARATAIDRMTVRRSLGK